MIKIAVTGASGMLGSAIMDYFSERYLFYATDLVIGFQSKNIFWSCFDLIQENTLENWLKQNKPDIVINCAAIVNVDACEEDYRLATLMHEIVNKRIVEIISEWNGKLVYISTDSVFDGFKKGLYVEEDLTNPPNIYAKTKLEGEKHVLNLNNGVVLRTNIFGWSRAEKISFVEWVIKSLITNEKVKMFTNVYYTPIHVTNLAKIIEAVITKNINGLYHATGSTSLSKYEFGVRIAKQFGFDESKIIPIRVDDIGLTASRPKNMSLDNSLLKKTMRDDISEVDEGIALLKKQYNNGWLEKIKNRKLAPAYRYWEV